MIDTTTGAEQVAPSTGPPLGRHLWALLGYFVLALVVTYPVVLHYTTGVPGDLIADRDQNLWNLWWVREALSRPTNPFQTGMLYYPYGVSLYYHTLGLPNALIGLVPQLLFGLPAAYNTVLLAAFTLSGYGAFRLALMYTQKPLAAFLGGLVFAFTPYTLDALKGQPEVLSVQWMPMYAEAWLRAMRGRAQPPTIRWGACIAAGMFFALAAYSSLYYAFYLLVFTIASLIWILLAQRPIQNRGALWATKIQNASVVAIVALALTAPLIIGLARDYDNPRFEVAADQAHRLSHSADLLSFLAPPHDHPLLGKSGGLPGLEEPPVHDYLSLGYIALALAVIGAVAKWRERDVPFWALLSLVSLVMAMGPELQVGRNLTGIPLPFKLIEGLPGIGAIAKPERFVVLTRMCMGVLAAWGVVWVSERLGAANRANTRFAPAWGTLAIVGLLALLLVELPIHPRYEQPLDISEGAKVLAAQKESGGLMELPFATQQVQVVGERMVGQTVHRLPIMSGYLARNYNSPIVDSCSPFWGFISPRDVPAEGPEIATPFLASRPLDVLNYFKIGLVALYNRPGGPNSPPMNPDDKAAYMSLLSRISSAPPVYAGDDETIYKADRTDLSQATPSFHLGGDWYPLEKSNGAPFRWVKGGSGTLCIFAPRAARAALVMDGTAFGQDRTVEISSDDKTLLSELVPSGGRFATLRTEPIDWPEGVTELRIAANGPGITPESLDPNTGDKRNLSVGFKGVHLESIAQK